MIYNYKDIKIPNGVRCRDLNMLHPVVKKKMETFIQESNDYLKNKGLTLFPIFTFRTAAQQQEAFDTGHSKARPGQSNHEFGLACDFGLKNSTCGYLDGSDKKSDQYLTTETYRDLESRFGSELGLEWGGNWIHFKDYPHFQYVKNTRNFTDVQLRAYLATGGDSGIIQ